MLAGDAVGSATTVLLSPVPGDQEYSYGSTPPEADPSSVVDPPETIVRSGPASANRGRRKISMPHPSSVRHAKLPPADTPFIWSVWPGASQEPTSTGAAGSETSMMRNPLLPSAT